MQMVIILSDTLALIVFPSCRSWHTATSCSNNISPTAPSQRAARLISSMLRSACGLNDFESISVSNGRGLKYHARTRIAEHNNPGNRSSRINSRAGVKIRFGGRTHAAPRASDALFPSAAPVKRNQHFIGNLFDEDGPSECEQQAVQFAENARKLV